MAVYGCVWLCMAVNVAVYVAVYGCVWLCMAVNVAVYGCVRL
jgi:hypothetical protein